MAEKKKKKGGGKKKKKQGENVYEALLEYKFVSVYFISMFIRNFSLKTYGCGQGIGRMAFSCS